MSAENNVHKGIALAELFSNMLLLNHTAANRNYHIRIFAVGFFQYANIAENSLLGVFPNGAGIEYYELSSLGSMGYGVAHLLKYSLKLFAVRKVLLTAVCVHKSLVLSGALLQKGTHRTGIVKFRHRKFLSEIN